MPKKEAEVEAKPLNLDDILGKPKNRVTKIGVELEGGWEKEKLPAGVRVERDGSVLKEGDEGALKRVGYPASTLFGEIPIGPMQVIQLNQALKKYYPQHVDKSCGMHVHMSFDSVYRYNILADSPAYQETVVEYLTRWAKAEGFDKTHHIWPRLENKNIYCQKKFWPDKQMPTAQKDHNLEREGHRYTMIHYCWERNRTVECRLLPMMDGPEQAARAIRMLIDVTNAYLIKADKARVKEGGVVQLGDGSIYEEVVKVVL